MQMEAFVRLSQTAVRDKSGGFHYAAVSGAEFPAHARLDGTSEKQSAQKETAAASYTITTKRNVVLKYHDVVQRRSDGVCFRVLSDGKDKQTPAGTPLDMRQVTAEEWSVPR